MCRGRIYILQLLLITTYSTFGQDLASNKPANLTLSQNETKQDSTITWIKISPITPTSSTTEATVKNSNSLNCTITDENISGENQNNDFAGSLRRKRRKRRRNKYKAWNQRRPEHSHKKHSTKVEITKPVQFLIPPDYQENLITKETSYYKNRNDAVEKFPSRTEKKITPPVRHLLPPLVDTSFINSVTAVSVRQEPKKSKHIDWSPNSTNRGSTKFKHTVYYSDSGNEIISNYEITSTTPKPQIKFTTNDDNRAFTASRATTEVTKNYHKLEYRPIVVQPTPVQFYTTPVPVHNHTTGFPSRETRINSLLSFEVANAGMQVINMTNFQKQTSPSFQNQFIRNNNYKQFEPSAVSRSPNAQQIPIQQSTAHPMNYQHSQSQDHTSQPINYQQPQSQQLTNYRQSQPRDQIPYQEPQPQQLSNFQHSQSPDRISPQINYQQTPLPELIPQQINYQQSSSQHQHKSVQNQQTRFSQPQTNYQQSQPQQQLQQPSRQSNYQQYQQTQLPPHTTASNSQNFQQLEHQQPYQNYNQQPLQNYQTQTTYSRPIEQRSTTIIPDLAINRTIASQIDKTDNFKGLDLAESKYFSDIPSEQEFNAVQNDGQDIPGIAGKDYPVFDQFLLQKRRFHCRGLEGYFADVTSRCQVFYICNGDGAGEPMLCPNGTLFSQELLVCDWWYNVDC